MTLSAPDLGMLRQLWRFRSYGRSHLGVLSLGVGMRLGELLALRRTHLDHVQPTGTICCNRIGEGTS